MYFSVRSNFQNGLEYKINLSGGTEKRTFTFSASHLDQEDELKVTILKHVYIWEIINLMIG
jgi:hypothetical protein